MAKQIKYVVAVVLKKEKNGKEFLVLKRPDDDPDLRGGWGFAATTLNPGELPEEGAKRICKEKLGCECIPERLLGIMFQKRNSYDIFLMDVVAIQTGEKEADITSVPALEGKTMYVEQKWSTDPMDLMPSAKNGSCCSSIFLTDRGILDRSEWIDSLEGSDLVA